MRSAIRLCLTLTAVAASGVLAACGGSGAPSNSTPSPPSTIELTPIAPPADTVNATATPETPAYDLVSIFKLELEAADPETDPDGLLSGPANRRAALQVADSLAAAGFDLSGIGVYVLPIAGTQEELLVVEMTLEQGLLTEERSQALTVALASAGDLELANITRVAINLPYEDETGAFLFTTTASIETLAGVANGTISNEEAQQLVLYEVRPVSP